MRTAGVQIIRFVIDITGAEEHPSVSQCFLLDPQMIESITDAILDSLKLGSVTAIRK